VRRRTLVMSAGVIALGLAGCSRNTSSGDGDSLDEETSTTESSIPGEVVHDGLETIEVLEHWTEGDRVMLRVRNVGEEPFPGSRPIGDDEPVIKGRTLTEQGNVVRSSWWEAGPTDEGPEEINPGTEAEIGFLVNAEEAARYELCLAMAARPGVEWEEVCE